MRARTLLPLLLASVLVSCAKQVGPIDETEYPAPEGVTGEEREEDARMEGDQTADPEPAEDAGADDGVRKQAGESAADASDADEEIVRYDDLPREAPGASAPARDEAPPAPPAEEPMFEALEEESVTSSAFSDEPAMGALEGSLDWDDEPAPEVADLDLEDFEEDAELSRSEVSAGEARRDRASRLPKTEASSAGSGSTGDAPLKGGVATSLTFQSTVRPATPPPALPTSEGPATEEYTNYGINAMTLVEEDGFSTFSVDVDTASYTIARRKLLEGALPPTASVRVEEFVNYFDYDYVGPTGDAPFAVNMEAAPHPFESTHHLLRVGVQGKELDGAERKPVRLTFLVDTSGSMDAPDKLPLARRALRALVNNLGPEDSVALVSYAGETRAVLRPTPATKRSKIYDAIESLSPDGGTAMSSGIGLAYEMASEGHVRGAENRVIVLSDGDANIGGTSHEEILRTIKQHAEEGITLSTIGFGMGNYKDTMMEQLANQGDGNYYYVDSYSEAQKVFGEDLSGTLQVIAKDVKIQVEFNPDAVHAYRLVGYENRDIADRDFRDDRVDAGEIGAGHQVTAVYDVVLKDAWRGSELATVRLRSEPPGPAAPAVEWSTVFPAELVRGAFADASADTRLAFSAATFAELLRGSHYTAEVSYAQLWAMVDRARRRGNLEDAELLDLIQRAGTLCGEEIAWQ